MSIAGIFQMLVRRWYFVVAAVMIAVAGASLGLLGTPPTYEARATLLMLPSAVAAGDKNGPANPYTALSSSLADAGQVVAAQVMSDDSAQTLAKQGAHALYTVAVDADFNAPVIQIVATGKTAQSAEITLTLVTSAFTNQLRTVQLVAGAPEKTLISLSKVTTTPKPQKILKKAIRNGIGGGVLGLLLGLLPIPLLERRKARGPQDVPAGPVPDEAPVATTEKSESAEDLFGPTTEVVPGMHKTDPAQRRASRRHARSGAAPSSDATDGEAGRPAGKARPMPASQNKPADKDDSDLVDEHAEDERLAAATRRTR